MANYTNLNALFTDMANAIRTKNGSTATIIADNFPTEIENLRTGFDYNNQSVTSIPDRAFYGCEDLNSVDCYNLTSVGASAFENCKSLKSVILWDSVESIGENAFKGCGNLTEIYVAWEEDEIAGAPWGADNATIYYSSVGSVGLAYSKTGNGYKVSKGECIETDVRIPMYYNGLPVTNIGDSAFYNCTFLTSITIPDSVASIGEYAFQDCKSLISIIIPDSVTSIGYCAFEDCTSLTSITYTGIVAQWQAITFGADWNKRTPDYTVHCTDGDIDKDGTITYH